jgi:hypothetical protein
LHSIHYVSIVTLICDSFQAAKEETSSLEQLDYFKFFAARIESAFKIVQNLFEKKDKRKSERERQMKNNMLSSEINQDPIEKFVRTTDEFILKVSNLKDSRDIVLW